MNSKLYFLIIFVIVGCGVKKYPKSPSSKNLPDIVNSYKYKTSDELEKIKKKKKKKEEEQKSQN